MLHKKVLNLAFVVYLVCLTALFFVTPIYADQNNIQNTTSFSTIQSSAQSDIPVESTTPNFGQVKTVSPNRLAENASKMVYNFSSDIGKIVPPLALFVLVICAACLIFGVVSKTLRKFAVFGILMAVTGLTIFYMAPAITVLVNKIAHNLQR